MANKGWVKLHRSITEHWVWDCEFSCAQAWVDLLVNANHSERKLTIKGQLIIIERGQQARSEVTLSKLWKWSRNKVRRFLKNLESDGMITQKATHLTSIITICNYSDFQGGDTTNGTGKEQLTEQVKDSRRNTNKNGKNDKEVIDQFNFEDIRAVWNEVCSNSSTICQTKKIVDSKTKKQLPVIYKNYLARCKSAGKVPVDKPTWCKSYFEIVHEWAAGWQNFKDGDVFKLHLEYATRLATYEKVIEWNEHND